MSERFFDKVHSATDRQCALTSQIHCKMQSNCTNDKMNTKWKKNCSMYRSAKKTYTRLCTVHSVTMNSISVEEIYILHLKFMMKKKDEKSIDRIFRTQGERICSELVWRVFAGPKIENTSTFRCIWFVSSFVLNLHAMHIPVEWSRRMQWLPQNFDVCRRLRGPFISQWDERMHHTNFTIKMHLFDWC